VFVFVGMPVIAVMVCVLVGVLVAGHRGGRAEAQREGHHDRNEGLVGKASHGSGILQM
jgi:hypothetical protein